MKKIAKLFVIVFFLLQACSVDQISNNQTQFNNRQKINWHVSLFTVSLEKTTGTVNVDVVKVIDRSGKILEEKKFDTVHKANVRDVINVMRKYHDRIEAIALGNIGLPALETETFFQYVKTLPKLQSFTSTLRQIMQNPEYYRGVMKLKGLTRLTIPWRDEVLEAVAKNNPDLEVLFLDAWSDELHFSDKGLESLISLQKLKGLFSAEGYYETGEIRKVLEHASKFKSLQALGLFEVSEVAMKMLSEKMLAFENLTQIDLIGVQEQPVLDFLKTAAGKFQSRPFSLSITRYSHFRDGSKEQASLLELLKDVTLDHLSLLDMELESAQYKQLENLKTVKSLAIKIPSQNEEVLISSLLRALPNLNRIELLRTWVRIINGRKFEARYLAPEIIERLKNHFPNVEIVAEAKI